MTSDAFTGHRRQPGILPKLLDDDRLVIPLWKSPQPPAVGAEEAGRCAALEAALSGKPAIYVTTATVLMSATISPTGFQERTFTLRRGDEVDLESLAKRLVDLDYDNEFEVRNPGEFSRRGGIIDIYSPLYDAPVRLEFWGNEIDRMRFFMPDSQMSFRDTDELRIVPRGIAVLAAPEEDSSTVLAFFPPDTPLVLCDPEDIAEHLETYSEDELQAQWQDVLATAATVQLLTGPAENVGQAAGAGSEGRRTGRAGTGRAGAGRAGATGAEAVPVLRIDALSLGAELADMLPELGDGAALWHWQQLRDALTRWATSDYTVVACCAGSGEAERFREMLQEDEKTRELPIQVEEHEIDRGLLLPSVRLVLLSDQSCLDERRCDDKSTWIIDATRCLRCNGAGGGRAGRPRDPRHLPLPRHPLSRKWRRTARSGRWDCRRRPPLRAAGPSLSDQPLFEALAGNADLEQTRRRCLAQCA